MIVASRIVAVDDAEVVKFTISVPAVASVRRFFLADNANNGHPFTPQRLFAADMSDPVAPEASRRLLAGICGQFCHLCLSRTFAGNIDDITIT